MSQTTFQSTLPAMRILENEHRYLSYLMHDWHTIVLNIQDNQYSMDEASIEFERLCQLITEFKLPFNRHARKEEQYFFPLLGKFIGHEQGPLVSIEQEHEEIHAYLDHFLHHATSDTELTLEQMKVVSNDVGEAFEILTVHFIKEESVLFPMTDQVMQSTDQNTLLEQLRTLIT